MPYKNSYFFVMSILLKKIIAKYYGDNFSKKILKSSKITYREMLNNVDDIGKNNPMASNIYMALIFISIWKTSNGFITIENLRKIIKDFMNLKLVKKILAMNDLTKEKTFNRLKEKYYKIKEWTDKNDKYKGKTWEFYFDENKHSDGVLVNFTHCPLATFAKKYNCSEVLPLLCEIDFLTIGAMNGVLYRNYTLATGDDVCDFWIVPNNIKNPK